MARIRTIKPEFWVSEQVAECSVSARLLFIGIWNFADDNGIIPRRPLQIKMQVFPADSFSKEDIEELIEELIEAGLLKSFETEGVSYLWVTGWSKHQKIDHPSSKYPLPPPENSANARENSPNARSGKERKGKERKGREDVSPETDEPSSGPTDGEVVLLEFPCDGKRPTWVLTQSQIDEWGNLYPSLDVTGECRKALAWVCANPSRRKTHHGMPAFLVNWLNRVQNKSATVRDGPVGASLHHARPTTREAPV